MILAVMVVVDLQADLLVDRQDLADLLVAVVVVEVVVVHLPLVMEDLDFLQEPVQEIIVVQVVQEVTEEEEVDMVADLDRVDQQADQDQVVMGLVVEVMVAQQQEQQQLKQKGNVRKKKKEGKR